MILLGTNISNYLLTSNSYFIDLFLKGDGEINWKAVANADWIKISKAEGAINHQLPEERIWVSIDWDKVPVGTNKKEAPLGHDYQLIPPGCKVNSSIDFVTADTTIRIGVSVFNPELKELQHYKGHIEDKGFVSINAENYAVKKDGTQAAWQTYEGIGYSGKVVTALPRSADSQFNIQSIVDNSPVLEYDFYTFNFGEALVYLQAIPTHAPNSDRGVRCAVAVDDTDPVMVDFQTFGRSEAWMQNVLKNASVQSVPQIVNKAGMHTLKIWMVDPGVMIDQILIDLGGWKKSYAFPAESKIK